MENKIQYQDHAPSRYWSAIFKNAWDEFSPSYLPNFWVTFAFVFISLGIGLFMTKPKMIVYGSGLGVCVLIMVFTHFIAKQLVEKPAHVPEIRAPKVLPAVVSLPPMTKTPVIARKNTTISSLKNREFTIALSHKTTAYSHFTNEQLKDAVLSLTPKMRIYVQQKHSIDMSRIEYFNQLMRQAKSEEERHTIWEMQSREFSTTPPLNSEYGALFKAEAILLHDELLKRLPSEPKGRHTMQADYEHPTNPIGLNMVIDDLEKLAKSLSK